MKKVKLYKFAKKCNLVESISKHENLFEKKL
jgi:hypothetical protein